MNFKRKLTEHILSILLVVVLFFVLVFIFSGSGEKKNEIPAIIAPYMDLENIDIYNPDDLLLLKETLELYYPGKPGYPEEVAATLEDYRIRKFTDTEQKTGSRSKTLSGAEIGSILWMYLKFIFVYVIVIALTYYGAETLGTIRFFRKRENAGTAFGKIRTEFTRLARDKNYWKNSRFYKSTGLNLLKAAGKTAAYLALFSPAYVLAYSFRTSFDDGALLFMILLGALSNGLLINYSNKFYTYLENESRRGYVLTSIVKNKNNRYSLRDNKYAGLKRILKLKKNLSGHVFSDILLNARYHYIPAIKEQASFLITGLIIIEMALNIQGHMGYELLRNLLYDRYIPAMFIILLIFILVKATEIIVDYLFYAETKKYSD